MIPYGRQYIDQDDIDSVVQVLQSDFLTQGPAIPAFEKGLSDYCGVSHAVVVNSATAGLHIACRALGLSKNDIAWTSPNTFPATSNAILFCGATVDFVDIDPDTYNLCPVALRKKLELAKLNGTLPKIVIPVHFAGQSCDMKAIADLSKEYGFAIIEDASHCVGGDYAGQKIGSCTYSDACIFSFHPVKIMTTGEGGAIMTNNPDLYKKLTLLRSHGITRDETLFESTSHGGWYYEQIDLAPNYRMTDIQAALGSSQLKKLDGFIKTRRALAQRYNELFADIPDIRPKQIEDSQSSWHLYVIQVNPANRQSIFSTLKEAGIGVNVHYIPVHTHPYYKEIGFKEGLCPLAENYYAGAITIPLYAGLKEDEQDYIVQQVKLCLNNMNKKVAAL